MNVPRREAPRRALRRDRCAPSSTSPPTTSSTAPRAPYREDDLPNPRSVYAITKLAGEHAALAYCQRALVVRTAGLYGLAGSARRRAATSSRGWLARARETGEHLRMVADQRLSPTFTADLATALVDGGRRRRDRTHAPDERRRLLVARVHRGDRRADRRIDVEVEPVDTTIPPGGADRPLNGVLAPAAARTSSD